jgi:hypothetical protein
MRDKNEKRTKYSFWKLKNSFLAKPVACRCLAHSLEGKGFRKCLEQIREEKGKKKD